MQIFSVVFALSRQINKQKYAKTFNFLCAGNKEFVKYQAQGGVNPKTSPLRTPLQLNVHWTQYAKKNSNMRLMHANTAAYMINN